ncbi:MAG TPA: thiol peroxidase [Gemmataceae bacterium]|nr:thiol peroxidase [Gemmataceae bacterium]
MPIAVTFKGNPVKLAGQALKAGDKAPDFEVLKKGLAAAKLADTPAKTRLFSVVPSLDTPVCSTQTKKFNDALAGHKDKVAAYTVSLDLPFAQDRFCGAAGISNMETLSDVHNHSFGRNYGVLIESLPLPLLTRAIFVVDKNGVITYAEYVPEVTSEPNYDAALAALKAVV